MNIRIFAFCLLLCLLTGTFGFAQSGITLVQHKSIDAGTTTSASLAFTSNNTAGNWVGIVIRAGTSNQVFTVNDSKLNTYQQAVQINATLDTPTGDTLAIFYAQNIAGGANTVTVSDTISGVSLRFAIFEYSGVATTNSLNVTAAAQGTGTAPNSGTATTTANGDLLFGGILTANAATVTAGSGYKIEETVPAEPSTKLVVEDQVQAAAGSASATASLAASGVWAVVLGTFRVASGGSAPTITSLSPNSGNAGTSITITGTNFGATQGGSTVVFGSTPASPTAWSATSITVPVPAGASSGNVVVTVGGLPSNGVSFTVRGITLVQHKSIDAGTTTSASLAFTSNNTAGNWVGIVIRAGTSNQVFTVNDSKLNTYQQAVQINATLDTPTGDTLAIFYAQNIAGGANTVTVSDTISGVSLRFAIFEYSGVATTNSLNVTAAAQGTGTAPNSGTATTTANGDLLFGGILTANAATVTAGSGYKIEETVPAEPSTKLVVEDQVQAAAGSASATASLAASGVWAVVLGTFRAVPVATPTVSPAAGTYTSAQTVTISTTTTGATVRYTTDGSTPSETAGTLYSGPITVSATTTINTIAYASGMTDSAITSATYTITTGSGVSTTITTSPASLGMTVDGTNYTAPQTFQWTAGSSHAIAVSSPLSGTTGTQYVFNNWSDSGAQSHSITVPSSATTYTASFTTQYQLTTTASPSADGSISPASGWFNAGSVVSISAAVNSPYQFTGFTGSLSGPATPQSLTIVGPATVTASFSLTTINYVYDDLGRLISVIDATGASANYKYDAVGNLLSITRQTPVAISFITPMSGAVGTPVTITGTGFSSQPSQDLVQFNGTAATVTSASASQIVASVPVGATTGPITVTAPSGNATSSAFTVTAAPNAPTIVSFNPTIGSASTLVTISGTNFDPDPLKDTVTIGGVLATVSAASATTITTSVPPQAGTGTISVQTSAGQATSSGNFTVVPNPYSASNIAFVSQIAIGNSATFGMVPATPAGMVLFNGTAGQQIRLLINTSLVTATLSLYNPNGTILYTTTIGPNASILDIPSPLPLTGTYTLVVAAGSSLTGSAALFVTTPPAASDFAIFELPNFNVPGYSVYVSGGAGSGSENVTLSLAGLPSGASGSFSSPTVSPNGISVLSIVPGTAAGGTYTFTITGTVGATIHSTTATLTVSPLPASWMDQDIGVVGTPGVGQYASGVFTIAGSGDGFDNSSDTFHYSFQTLNGDGTIIARLVSESNLVGNASAGLMIRETLDPGATFAFVGFCCGSNYNRDFEFRNSTLGQSEFGGTIPNLVTPYWFMLVRSGNTLSGYSSAGGTWIQVGSTQTISMAATVYVGLAVASYADPQVSTATFDNVLVLSGSNTTPDFYLATIPNSSVTIAGGGSVGYPKVFVDPVNGFSGAVSLSVTGLPAGATASFSPSSLGGSGSSLLTIATSSSTPAGNYPLIITGASGSLTHIAPLMLIVSSTSVSLPVPWTTQEIGPAATGTGSIYSNGAFTVAGVGNVGGVSDSEALIQIDSFQFAYQTLNGNGTIIARVTAVSSNSDNPGLMIRETLAPESANVFLAVINFQYRPLPLADTAVAAFSSLNVPGWLKLVRSGNTFTGYSSVDGITWVQEGTVNVSMAGTVYIGLAVADEEAALLVVDSATFDNVTITNP